MNDLLIALCDILKKQCDVYKSELDIADKKKTSIIENDIESINATTKQEQEIMTHMVKLEEERGKIVRSIGKELGRDSGELTISEIIEICENKELSERLGKLKDELLDIVEKLKVATDLNKQLINSSLEYIQFNINLFFGAGGQETYGSTGHTYGMNSGVKAFDKKS